MITCYKQSLAFVTRLLLLVAVWMPAALGAAQIGKTGEYFGSVKYTRFNVETGEKTKLKGELQLDLGADGGYAWDADFMTIYTVNDGEATTATVSVIGENAALLKYVSTIDYLDVVIHFDPGFAKNGKATGSFHHVLRDAPAIVHEGTFKVKKIVSH